MGYSAFTQGIGNCWIQIGQFTKNADFDFSENLFETVELDPTIIDVMHEFRVFRLQGGSA